MSSSSSPAESSAVDNRFPPQIRYIVGNEACERFSFYGLKSILAGYAAGELARGGLGMTKDKATTIIHLFVFANYFMPLLGAWLSDRYWGRYRTILSISLFYCVGHGVMALSDLAGSVETKTWLLYAGLALVAFGAGGIKPCVSAFVGDQFKPTQAHLMEKAYGAFYWSVNFGSFFSFLLIPRIKNTAGYGWAFAVPGILMALATLIFYLGTKHYVRVPPSSQTRTAGFLAVFLEALRSQKPGAGHGVSVFLNVLTTLVLPVVAVLGFLAISLAHDATGLMGWVGRGAVACVALWYVLLLGMSLTGRSELPELFWAGAKRRFREEEVAAARSVSPILFVFALVPAFWALFDQSASTWVMQGTQMEPVPVGPWLHWLIGDSLGAEQMQSMNPLLVMILVPTMTFLVYPTVNKLVKVTLLRRIGVGLFLTASSYLIVAYLQFRIEGGAKLSVLWQTVPYVALTTGEVLVSITGLEFAYTQAAKSMKSTIMSFWLLTVAFGNLLVSAITILGGSEGSNSSVTSGRFLLYATLTFVVAAAFTLVAVRYQYRDRQG